VITASDAPGTGPLPKEETPFGAPSRGAGRRWLRLGLFGLLLVAAGAGSYLLTRKPAAAAPVGHAHGTAPAADSARAVMLSAANEKRIGVVFAEATLAPLTRSVRTVGLVTYDETRVETVTPLIDGLVDRLYVNFTGQAVRRGDPLFSIYSPMVVSTAQELVLAKRLREEVAGGTPDAVRGAEGLLESARRRLLYWNIPPAEVERIERTGEIRKNVTLRSPVNGVVIEKAVLQGQRIMPGDPVYKIADLGIVWLEGQVFEQDLPAVRLGQQVTAEFQALPGQVRAGRITYIYPTLDPETRTARVRVVLANADLRLKPGMYATFRFDAPTPPVISVPRSAVLATGKRDLVFVRDADGMLAPREVILGVATDDRAEVLKGIAAGETVVASATFLVDAESNLGSAIGGMANMPGMDVQEEAPGPAPTMETGATPEKSRSPASAKE
jgi:membrane fusion protein, copper/silver efflux system